MGFTPIDDSQRRAARAAGASCLLSMVVVVAANFGIAQRLVSADAAATARNVLANETLFRLNVVLFLLYSVGTIVLLSALYVVLRPVSCGVATLAASFRLVWAVTWLFMGVNMLTLVRTLKGAPYLQGFETGQLQGLARLTLATNHDVYYIGLLFYALASTVCGWLWFRSRYIPRWLGAFGIVSSAWCVATTIAYLVDPGFKTVVNWWWFDSPMGAFEMITSVWLLVKGLPRPPLEASV